MSAFLSRLLVILVLCSAAGHLKASSSSEQKDLREEVIVTANAYPVPFGDLGRTVRVLTRDQILGLPIRSLAELLAATGLVDVRSRGPHGMQSDFSIRGSAFSQVLILVNGFRLNDAQTAHHNSDLPVNLHDIERVEVLAGTGSSVHGADAFAGAINIITRKEASPRRVAVSAGQFGLFEGSLLQSLTLNGWQQHFSISATRSDGFMEDRDHNALIFRTETQLRSAQLAFGYSRKEFGANGFYGPAPSREWTDSSMVTAAIPILSSKRWRTDSKFQYRSHGDRFIYDMRVPQAFAARHRTHSVSGGLSALLKISESAQWRMGAEGGLDTIGSNSLGHHSVSRSAGYGELEWKISRLLTLTPGFRFDEYQVYGSAFSPAVSGSYWLLPTLRWRSTLGRAFRVPSFTERFYRDPNHQATSHLRPERAVAAETGIDWFAAKNVLLHGVIFRRWETDVIDWVRSNENQPWTTTNIHSLRTSGFESGIELWQGPVQARASYGYLQTHADLASLLSKYVLDYPKHSVTLNFTSELRAGWRLGLTGNYRSPTNRSDYWLLGCRLERRWGDRVVFVDGSNLLNTWYEEIRGIRMPGRWIRVGFEFDPFAF